MTIPKQFYDELQLGNEVICELVNNSLVIKPVMEEPDFSKYILEDLIKEGYEAGDAMLKEFAYRKKQVSNAVQRMIEEERDYKTYDNVEQLFHDLMDDTKHDKL